MLDVITVPDFSGKGRARFEWLTLFFLASWEQRVRSGEFALHVACIGKPPQSVVQLADRVKARVTSSDPAGAGGFENKARGFEVEPTAKWLLLLDTDMIFLHNLAGIGKLQQQKAVYAAPAGSICFKPDLWPLVYRHLGLSPPERRITLLKGHIDPALRDTFPYFNGGALLLPWDYVQALSTLWAKYNREARALSTLYPGNGFEIDDQVGLVIALMALAPEGVETRLLPARFNALWWHFQLGAPRIKEIDIFHATTFLYKYEGGPPWEHIKRYHRHLRNKVFNAFRQDVVLSDPWTRWPHALSDLRRLKRHTKGLYERIQRTVSYGGSAT